MAANGADPRNTKQHAGSLKHKEHMAQQRSEILARRKAKRGNPLLSKKEGK